jgi:hypothetical protein
VLFGSLLLILVAVAMLGLGLVAGSNAFLVGSIAASLLAAVALVVGARRAAAARTTLGAEAYDGLGDDASPAVARPSRPGRKSSRRRVDGTVYGHPARAEAGVAVEDQPEPDDEEPAGVPDQNGGEGPEPADVDRPADIELEFGEDEEPPDEPAAQIVPPDDADRVARMSAPVLVIDSRPRYHLAGCVHLLGRESESLPVSEAVELGFTPCGLCEPDSALLADARRS